MRLERFSSASLNRVIEPCPSTTASVRIRQCPLGPRSRRGDPFAPDIAPSRLVSLLKAARSTLPCQSPYYCSDRYIEPQSEGRHEHDEGSSSTQAWRARSSPLRGRPRARGGGK